MFKFPFAFKNNFLQEVGCRAYLEEHEADNSSVLNLLSVVRMGCFC